MRSVDVNVLVNAHRPEAPDHTSVRAWLDRARRGPEPLVVLDVVASGFLRVVTHPKIFKEPTPLATAIEFLRAIRASPAFRRIEPGDLHWEIFTNLCVELRAVGNAVPDLYLAAAAIEQGSTFVSTDRRFAGIPNLRWERPVGPGS